MTIVTEEKTSSAFEESAAERDVLENKIYKKDPMTKMEIPKILEIANTR